MARVLLFLLIGLAAGAEERQAPPAPAAVAPLQAAIQSLYPAEYGRRSAAEHAAFAQRLLALAEASPDKPDERFALLREARTFAARAGEATLGFQIHDRLAELYRIEADAERLAFANDVAAAVTSPESVNALLEGVIALTEQAIARDDYGFAAQAATQIDGFARRLRNRSQTDRTRALVQRVRTLEKAYRELGPLTDLLGEWTAVGHQRYGWFLCVIKEEWARGLDHLRRSKDTSLAALAQADLAAQTPAELMTVADQWHTFAQTLRGSERIEVLVHATNRYRHASMGLSGLDFVRVDQQLKVLTKELRPRLASSRVPPGAVLMLSFEPSTIVGTVVNDLTPHRHRGQIRGAVLVSGPYGGALRFDGTAQVVIPNHPSLQTDGDCTIAMWLNPDALGARRNPWSKSWGGEGAWTQEPEGIINFFQGTAGRDAPPYAAFVLSDPLVINTWTHVAIVRNLTARTMVWYKNGVPVATGEAPYPRLVASPNDITIGNGYAGGYSGLIDEVLLYPRALSAAEIKALVAGTITGRR